MKNLQKFTLLFTLLLFIGVASSCAQEQGVKFPPLDKSPADIALLRLDRAAPVLVKVVYGRPQKKGRVMFGVTEPYGKVWRTGANEATEVTFYKDANFGGQSIKAGTYVLHTIPGEKEWVIILNSNLNVWGAYQYDQTKDVTRFSIPVSKGEESLEAFSIAFDKGENMTMVLGWDTTRVVIPLKF